MAVRTLALPMLARSAIRATDRAHLPLVLASTAPYDTWHWFVPAIKASAVASSGRNRVLRFRLMVKRDPRMRSQASEGEAQHGLFCWTRRVGQGNERLHCG